MPAIIPRHRKYRLEVLMKSLFVCLETKTCRPSGETTIRALSREWEGEMKSFVLIAGMIFLGCSISGCGGYSTPTNSQTAPSLAGNWQFTYTSSKSGTATVSGTLSQTGNNFSGNVTIANSCAASGMISGTISGLSLSGTLTESNPETISVTGTVSSDYSSANGTYQVMSATGACAAASGDSGTWAGTHTTASGGVYRGTMQPADRIPVQLALNLKEDAGQVSGTATFTNSACLHSMNLAGTLSGMNLELHGDSGTDDSIILSGTTDSASKTLTLNSTVSGPCQAESGVGTLTKLQ
jgi:hypothetical protein